MLIQKIKDDLSLVMKAQDTLKVSVLRMLLSELNYKKIDIQRELDESDVVAVLNREVKKRNEAIESYKAGGRGEQAEQEAKEAEILKAYLPEMMSEQDLRAEIEIEMKKIDAATKANFGLVMKTISPLFRGKADGGMVARMVKELINTN